MGYSFRLPARVILYASFHRQVNTYHGTCYTSLGTLAGTRNSSMSITDWITMMAMMLLLLMVIMMLAIVNRIKRKKKTRRI